MRELRFIHNRLKMGIQWMVCWWVLVHCGRSIVFLHVKNRHTLCGLRVRAMVVTTSPYLRCIVVLQTCLHPTKAHLHQSVTNKNHHRCPWSPLSWALFCIPRLGCEKYFCRVIVSTAGSALIIWHRTCRIALSLSL